MHWLDRFRCNFCRALFLTAVLQMTGCALETSRPVPIAISEPGAGAALSYYQGLLRMTPGELARERNILTALPPSAFTQLRTAMLLGLPRWSPDLPRGLSLLEAILKSQEPAASNLQPVARLLADSYAERIRLETQTERQMLINREAARRQQELQEKLDGLAGIEHSLRGRGRQTRPTTGGGQR